MAGTGTEITNVKDLSAEQVASEIGSVSIDKIGENVSEEVTAKVTSMINTIKSLEDRDIEGKNAFSDMTKSIGSDIRSKVAYQSDLLSSPMNAIMSKNKEDGDLSAGLLSLRNQVELVNPGSHNLTDGGLRKLFSKIPGVGSKLEKWWSKYQTVARVIEDILNNLEKGKEVLKKDNITLRSDRDSLLKFVFILTDRLTESSLLDAGISKALGDGELINQKYIEEDVLYYLRQEIQDMQLSLGAANQSIMVADIVRKANEELIRSTERTLNVSSIALKSAAGLEVALSHQKKQLEAVQATNDMTTELLKSTAKKAKTQGVEIVTKANDISAQIEGMKEAFADCIEAYDILDNYKKEALPVMAENINTLNDLNVQMKEKIERTS